MVIVALETATRAGSVALAIDGTAVGIAGDPTRRHGDRLPGEIVEWLHRHGRTMAEVELFAVVTGPGSFTGLRVGIATVQGLAMATGRPVVGIPTLETLAEGWLAAADDPGGHIVVACLDGQRGEVFAEAWIADRTAAIDACPRLFGPVAHAPETVARAIVETAPGRPVVIVGDGGLRYADVFARLVPQAAVVTPAVPLAATAARLAGRRQDRAGTPHALRPLYLRAPDAALPRERAARAAGAYTIRRLTGRGDLAAIETLQRQTFSNPWGADAIRWELEHTDVARLYAMQAPGGATVAYCACWIVVDELHINSLAVDATHRRLGLARRLLEHVLRDAAAAGATAATLEVRTSNTAARRLYEGLGFSVEGVRRDYYQDPREDAIILWKRHL